MGIDKIRRHVNDPTFFVSDDNLGFVGNENDKD